MANKIVHAAERKAFEVVLDNVGKKTIASRDYVAVVDSLHKVLKGIWTEDGFDRLRKTFSKDGKWTEFFNNLLDYADPEYLKGLFMSLGFETAMGYHEVQKNARKYGMHLPWVIIFDPTSACNLHCTGCWANDYSKTLNMTYEAMDNLVQQGKELGIHAYIMTGGEPTVRKNDIFKLAKKHSDCAFMLFTNGTLVDQAFCDEMKACKNIILSMSIEGMGDATDARRGKGTFQKVMDTMDLLHKNGLVYGTSICYTRANCEAVTSDEFLDFLIRKGVAFSWYFHFMPTGMDTSLDLVPTPEQREYMYHRVREVRDYEGGKPIFLMDFQNDGEWVHGCIAGGKDYCHINANGDVEPCVFIHYSNANINEKPLIDCLTQPIFREYQKNQPFNENLLQPCPFLENPDRIKEIVNKTNAKSTEMVDPESVEHLTAKTQEYAKEWAPVADKLWKSNHPDYVPKADRKENAQANANAAQ